MTLGFEGAGRYSGTCEDTEVRLGKTLLGKVLCDVDQAESSVGAVAKKSCRAWACCFPRCCGAFSFL